MRLLIVEDEEDLALPLKRTLERKGYAVDFCADGKSGLENARVNEYDCILLDLNLPEIDGIEVAKKLRKEKIITPIIMVTARTQIYNKLEGFDVGADDYISKPFNLDELIARVNAVIKRDSINKLETMEVADLKLHPDQNKVELHDKEIILSNKESALLEYLIRNKGKTVSTEEILEHVWDDEIDDFSDTVKTHVKTLRQKIDPDKKILKTIRGKGYLILS